MTIYQEVEIDLDIDDIYKNLSRYEKEELFEILLENRSKNSNEYYLESLFLGKNDNQILSDRKTIDKLIKQIKYNHVDTELVKYFIDELSY